MSKCFIIIGRLNKRLLLPLFASLIQIINVIINNKFDLKEGIFHNYLFLYLIAISFGQMSIRLYPYIFKISNKHDANIRISKKRKCLHYFILCLLFILNICFGNLSSIFTNKRIESNLFPNSDLNFIFTEIIFLCCISAFLLKYKYYKHHIISLVIFMIINIICFFLQNHNLNIKINFFIYFVIFLLHITFDAAYNCYQKYMMEKFYYSYWNVAFVPGIIQLICGINGLIIQLVLSSKEIYSYFNENKLEIVFRIILPFIFHVIMCPLFILILYYFKPDFILIIFQLASIIKGIMNSLNSWKLYVCVALNILQILVLMIYLEILELNFCGLNENTQRNIDLRGQDDFFLEGRDSSTSSNDTDQILDDSNEENPKIENEIETKEKAEEEEEKKSDNEKDKCV